MRFGLALALITPAAALNLSRRALGRAVGAAAVATTPLGGAPALAAPSRTVQQTVELEINGQTQRSVVERYTGEGTGLSFPVRDLKLFEYDGFEWDAAWPYVADDFRRLDEVCARARACVGWCAARFRYVRAHSLRANARATGRLTRPPHPARGRGDRRRRRGGAGSTAERRRAVLRLPQTRLPHRRGRGRSTDTVRRPHRALFFEPRPVSIMASRSSRKRGDGGVGAADRARARPTSFPPPLRLSHPASFGWPFHPVLSLSYHHTASGGRSLTKLRLSRRVAHSYFVYTRYYAKTIAPGSAILDICSSWVSHYPAAFPATMDRIAATGISPLELRANAQLSDFVARDLNKQPALPFADASFDVVTCVVSVDYLTRPREVLHEVARVLRPGGRVVFSQSNRLFFTKAVRMWTGMDDLSRLEVIGNYVHFTPGFGAPRAFDITAKGRGAKDPMYIVEATRL